MYEQILKGCLQHSSKYDKQGDKKQKNDIPDKTFLTVVDTSSSLFSSSDSVLFQISTAKLYVVELLESEQVLLSASFSLTFISSDRI